MFSKKTKPKWWQLYLVLPLLIALFTVDHRLKVSTTGHEAVQIGIILLVYLLIHLWLKANTAALAKLDRKEYYGRVRVIQIPPSQLPESYVQNGQMLLPSGSEIKGVLSDTFEMDNVDALFYTGEDVVQESKKE
jgi:hypothetical protein